MIVPTTLGTKVKVIPMFILFHVGVVSTTIAFLENKSLSNGDWFTFIFFIITGIGVPFAIIGYRYLIVRITGKGDWIYNQKDLDRYNERQKNGDVKQ